MYIIFNKHELRAYKNVLISTLKKEKGNSMNQLIKIEKQVINGAEVNSVNSRHIYTYLEIGRHYADWIKSGIEKYDFKENEDLTLHKFVNGKTIQIDYLVTLDMAKELCMVSTTDKGKEVRKYFLDLERQLNQPLSYEEIFKQTLLMADNKIKLLTQEKELNQPKVDFADKVTKTNDSMDVETFSKILYDTSGMQFGRNNLMKWFRNNGYLMDNINQKQNVLNAGWMLVKEGVFFHKPTGESKPYIQPGITGKGQVYFTNKLLNEFEEVAS